MSLSATVSQIEPVHTPCAPIASAAAICEPCAMPPAASTGVSAPTASITCGHSTIELISPVWPPASVPCATTMSTPISRCFCACRGLLASAATEHAVLVRGVDDVLGRRSERVHEQLRRVLERDVDLRRARCVSVQPSR